MKEQKDAKREKYEATVLERYKQLHIDIRRPDDSLICRPYSHPNWQDHSLIRFLKEQWPTELPTLDSYEFIRCCDDTTLDLNIEQGDCFRESDRKQEQRVLIARCKVQDRLNTDT